MAEKLCCNRLKMLQSPLTEIIIPGLSTAREVEWNIGIPYIWAPRMGFISPDVDNLSCSAELLSGYWKTQAPPSHSVIIFYNF